MPSALAFPGKPKNRGPGQQGRANNAKANLKGKGRKEEVEVEVEAEAEEGTGTGTDDMDETENIVEEGEGQGEEMEERGYKSWSDELPFGLAVIHISHVGTREGVLLSAAGCVPVFLSRSRCFPNWGTDVFLVFFFSKRCTALLYIPFSLLLPSATAASTLQVPSLLDLHHPILSVSSKSIAPETEFWVSLDLNRSAVGSDVSEEKKSIRKVMIKDGKLVECSSGELEARVQSEACRIPSVGDGESPDATLRLLLPVIYSCSLSPSGPAVPKPSNTDGLYPVLALLHRPDSESYEREKTEKTEKNHQINQNLKRAREEEEDDTKQKEWTSNIEKGKRAKGRKETLELAKEAARVKREKAERTEREKLENETRTEVKGSGGGAAEQVE